MTNSLVTRIRLELLIRGLRKCERMAPHVELTQIGDIVAATAYSDHTTELMPESVATGLAATPDLALLKALTEYVERQAFQAAGAQGVEACLTERSDGVAAFPRVANFSQSAERTARMHAYSEAVERFVWATWWDNFEITHTAKAMTPKQTRHIGSLLSAIENCTPLKGLQLVMPATNGAIAGKTCILLGELKGGGFISGGAVDIVNEDRAIFRAASEMLRHSFAIKRIKDGKAIPTSFYEERLSYFGLGYGDKLVRRRLSQIGSKLVELPALKLDEPIPHALNHLVAVHRCYFENQPAFIGGQLERLCI